MYALMYYQMALLTECFTTHFTGIRVLAAMYTLMSFQMALVNE